MAVPEGATKLGTVGIAYKGVYNELQTYKYANAVYYNGSTYIALIDNPAGFPSNDGVNWRYLAQGFLQQAISELTVIDESGILGEVNAEVNAQEFLSKIAELEQGLEDTKANKADTLDTLEEIVANTQSGKVAGALAVKELNSNLKSKVKTYSSIPTASDLKSAIAVFCALRNSADTFSSFQGLMPNMKTKYIDISTGSVVLKDITWSKTNGTITGDISSFEVRFVCIF